MKNKKLSYKAAALYAAGIYFLIFLMIGVLMFFGRSAFVPVEEAPRPDWESNMLMPITGFVVSYLYLFALFLVNFKILESNIKGRKKSIIAIGSTLVTAIILSSAFFGIQTLIIDADSDIWNSHARLGSLVKDLILAIIVIFSAQIIYLSNKKQQMALEYESMKAENAKSRFEALKNQLDPHFLFNTFNTLDSLIQEDPTKAHDYLHQLTSVFRYVMPNKDLTTLEEELNFTRNYSSLMQLRYEENLIFEFDIEERLLNYEIVPLSVQTLVENAIKHNVISPKHPLVIRISTNADDSVTVSNVIQPKKTPESGGGIGLSNLAERFKLKIQKEISIRKVDGYFSVDLPLRQPGKK